MADRSSILLRFTNLVFFGKLEWAMGWRPTFGDGLTLLRRVRDAELRSNDAWLLPALAGFFLLLCLMFYHLFMEQDRFATGAMFRVIVFDAIVFVFALLSGILTTQKWRTNSAQLEELSLSPSSPFVVSKLVVVGPLGIWATLIAMMVVLEIFFPIRHLLAVDAIRSDLWANQDPMATASLGLLAIVFNTLFVITLGWFHFETVRLSLNSFATRAIPSESMFKVIVFNSIFLMVTIAVLTSFGFFLTGCCMLFGLMGYQSSIFGHAGSGLDLLWFGAAFPSLVAVIWLKRLVASSFEKPFFSAWLFYQWWGAGERRQPRIYPASFHALLPYWEGWFRKEEWENAKDSDRARRERHRYSLMMAEANVNRAMRTGAGAHFAAPQVNADKSSDSPSQSQDPHNGPSHDRAPQGDTEQSSESR